MSNSKFTKKNWDERCKSRHDRSSIIEGQTAVTNVLSRCEDDEFFEFSASRRELMTLLYHFCDDYLAAGSTYFFYGQCGGEWRIRAKVSDRIERLGEILGEKAVEEMFEAVKKERDANIRLGLCPKGLELYEGVLNGDSLEKWHAWNHGLI